MSPIVFSEIDRRPPEIIFLSCYLFIGLMGS
jgi:hypothetical protein